MLQAKGEINHPSVSKAHMTKEHPNLKLLHNCILTEALLGHVG